MRTKASFGASFGEKTGRYKYWASSVAVYSIAYFKYFHCVVVSCKSLQTVKLIKLTKNA